MCVKSSDASAKSFTRPADSVSRKGVKIVLAMEENLWENNLNFVNDVTTIYVKYICKIHYIRHDSFCEKKREEVLISYRPSYQQISDPRN